MVHIPVKDTHADDFPQEIAYGEIQEAEQEQP
jgi:hypothetical protein